MNNAITFTIEQVVALVNAGIINISEARSILFGVTKPETLEEGLRDLSNKLPKMTMEQFIARELVNKVFSDYDNK